MDQSALPNGVTARMATGVNGLAMRYLEAGDAERPTVLLLHGFPEMAYSWRKVMPALADAGYRVIAPDQRGYGETTGWDDRYDGDLASFRPLNLVRDALGLMAALGVERTAGVFGHDFGARVAAFCALLRPDVFPKLALMSAPFAGPPRPPESDARRGERVLDPVYAALARLDRPRKHYQRYYCTREAARDMNGDVAHQRAFLRAYYHHKSADWSANQPYRLAGWTAEEAARMPTYYVMDLDQGMPETVAVEAPSAEAAAACRWLTNAELEVYARAYARTGYQGGLNWYRCGYDAFSDAELEVFAGRPIEPPTIFISGRQDWGTYQRPGALEALRDTACARFEGVHLVDGAGHWVQQEQPEAVVSLLLDHLART